MEVGDRHEIEGVEHEIISRGTFDGEGGYDVEEGRIPLDGEEGVLIAPEGDSEWAFWLQPVSVVQARERVAALELEMDALMPDVRREFLRYEEEGMVPLSVAAALARAACAYGYVYALNEEPQGELARRSGYTNEGALAQ